MKRVAIVGGGPTRKLAPFDDLSVEIWQLNEAPGITGKRCDVCFQMHDPGIYKDPKNRVDPNHWEWLKQYHGDMKIYMQKVDPEVPNSAELPYRDMCDKLLRDILQIGKRDRALHPVELFTFSGVYAVALAIFLGYSHILVYGIDLINTEEYRYQRESFAFWIGYAAGYGVKLEIYGAETLFNRPLYGYETFKEKETMLFTIEERIQLYESVLPREADMITMRIIREFRKELEFSDQELKDLGLRAIPPGAADPMDDSFVNGTQFMQYRWLPEANDHVKDIEVGEVTRKVVQKSFEKFDKEGKFTEALLSLYDKFVPGT